VHSHFFKSRFCALYPKQVLGSKYKKPLFHEKVKNMSKQEIIDALRAAKGDTEKAADLVLDKRTVSLTDFEDRDRVSKLRFL
jgi:hypothetical protein